MNSQLGRGPFATPPITLNLIIANFVVWLACTILPIGETIRDYGMLYWVGSEKFHVYQIFTYMFLHADFSHMFFNMFSLWMFGRTLEIDLGPKKFLTYFFVCGVGAALLHMGVSALEWLNIKSQIAADAAAMGQTAAQLANRIFTNHAMLGASGAVMGVVMEALPFAVFVIFTNMIVSGTIVELLGSYKMILIIFLLVSVYLVGMVLWISARKKVSPAVLVKKILPTFLVALTTASSAAAFSTNVKDANKRLGIDKNLVDFGIPFGQVLFKMSEFAMFIPIVLTFAENYGIAITPVWLILAYITVWLISFAVPPVAGGAIMGFTVVFAQLGIPMEAMAIAIALNAITDFPLTAMNVTGWQLTMIDVADSLGRLDKETLRKK